MESGGSTRAGAGGLGRARRRGVRALVLAAVGLGCLAAPGAGLAATSAPHVRGAAIPGDAATYEVGAAREDITPTSLLDFYLGGYGIGPVHEATAVLRPIYTRVIAIRDRHGNQAIIGAIDAQGYSVAYQQGPYGIADIASDIQHELGIPASHIILQSTHSHNGPDDLGVWGGVPDAYLAYVKAQTEKAIRTAVAAERPAALRWGTADMTGFSGTFGSDTDQTHTGDNADYPIDNQLRVLQGVSPAGQVLATLVNYSSHATVYGPLNKVSPDWPGATATFLEHDERGIPPGTAYGYPGSVAVVTVGAVGHTWPAGTPRGTDPAVDPPPKSDNGPADHFGNAVARMAMSALQRPVYERTSVVAGASRDVDVLNTNGVLLTAQTEPANSTPLGGYKIMRANTPPWDYGDVYVAPVVGLRVGDLPFFSVPGEPYPSLHVSLASEVAAPATFIFGLAEDQLGYAEEVSDYNGAFQCSLGDEWFFTISPTFGSDVVRLQRANAQALGFRVQAPTGLGDYGPGPVPPATNCTQQQTQSVTGPAGTAAGDLEQGDAQGAVQAAAGAVPTP